MFWGLIMESGKRYTQTVERAFHVSMACLEPQTADNENVSVMLAFDNRDFILCNLNKHKAIQTQLDLNFQSGDKIAFLSTGKGRVHLTGYLLETDEDEDEEDHDSDIMNSMDASDTFEKSDSFVKGTGKRKNEPQLNKTNSKKAKTEPETVGESSDDEEDDDEDEEGSFNFGDDSDELDSNEEEDDEDDDDDDDDDDDEEEDSDEEMEIPSPKQKTPDSKKKAKQQMKSPNEMQQNKNKTPNEKQNKSLTEKQQKNKTPGDKQKNKSPNVQAANTPNQKSPGNQMNGMSGQQQSGKKNKKGQDTPKGAKSPGGDSPQKKVLEGGVIVEDVKVGNGPVAKPGRQVSVYYVGRLRNNNKQFDSTTEGSGFKFRLGRGEVIKGWDIGVNGMKVGGKRKIVCPPTLAYGNKGSPPAIPPNSTLVFDVELRAVN